MTSLAMVAIYLIAIAATFVAFVSFSCKLFLNMPKPWRFWRPD